MSFIHGYLLGGLVLAGLPILIHLIMRQKPRQIAFPAFRFLKRRASINRRRIRLQHLLLLALRMALIAALCLALARPRVESSSASGSVEQPVAVVFLFDTSPSMDYVVGGESRLKTAQRMVDSLLDEMADGSRVAVLDSGDDPGADADWTGSLSQARSRVKALTTRPASFAVNSHLYRALQLLKSTAAEEKSPPCVLYVISDRTRPSWSEIVKPQELPPGVRAVFVDVGVEEPHDLAITRIEVDPPVVEPGKPLDVYITVRATGGHHSDQQLVWQIDDDPDQTKQPVRAKFSLAGGAEKRFPFHLDQAPPLPANAKGWPYQITARLETADALVFNNSRSATFLVRKRRSVLIIADETDPPIGKGVFFLHNVFQALEQKPSAERPFPDTFRAEVVSTSSAEEWKEDPAHPQADPLREHAIVILFQVAEPKPPSPPLWKRLHQYVDNGGNLIIVPGGEEMDDGLAKFNDEGKQARLLPATLVKRIDPNEPVRVAPTTKRHPIPAWFEEMHRAGYFAFDSPQHCPSFARYWEVKPVEGEGLSIFNYTDEQRRPFLLEREVGKGKVLMFTTPLDRRRVDPKKEGQDWNTLWIVNDWFGMALVDQACLYLAGKSSSGGEVNFVCGKPVLAPLLGGFTDKQYVLRGPPGLTLSETKIPPTEARLLAVPQATPPGNYRVEGESGTVVAGFSVNIDSAESNLTRVPAAEIEAVLGENAVLPTGTAPRLQDAVKGGRAGHVELLPWLMMAVLLVLAVESVLANKFYKREPKSPDEAAAVRPAVREVNHPAKVAS